MKKRIGALIEKFKDYKILVIGDAILDTYIIGTTDRVCREAPVQVVSVQEEEHLCGGAANVAINVAALGAETYFLTVIGNDESAKTLLNVLRQKNIHTEYIIQDRQRTTLAKKRITASSNILLRVDEGGTDPLSVPLDERLCDKMKKLYQAVDAVVLSDYSYGVVTTALIRALGQLRADVSKPLIIDSKELHRFREIRPTAVKPNYEETILLLDKKKVVHEERVTQVLEHGKNLSEITGAGLVAVTLDNEGVILFEKGRKPYRVLAVAQDNKNSIGAGDTFISALTLALTAGTTSQMATEIAAAAAAVVVQKEGTVVCSGAELKSYFNPNPKYIQNREELLYKAGELKKEGKKIVFTNGCFDILHKGHVTFLNQAKALGDILIVGINADESISRLKGPERPINSLEDRIAVLAALQSVDYLVSFEEDTSIEILKGIPPDIFVKGGDYTVESIPEAALVIELGGQVKIISLVNNRSTTSLIKKIQDSDKKSIPKDRVRERKLGKL